ncbi:MAG: hypothetical protein ABI605_05395 [Rhizobacter sp.]
MLIHLISAPVRLHRAALILLATISVCACGGGSPSSSITDTPPATFDPYAGANVVVSGAVATGDLLPGTPVTIFNAAGSVCAQANTNANGQFVVSAKCVFPLLIAADTPELEGKGLFTIIPTITVDGQRVAANLTPITSVITQLVIGGLPKLGAALSKKVASADNLAAANAKVHEVLDPLLLSMGSSNQDFLAGQIVKGVGQDMLMDNIAITFEAVASTSQNIYRFNVLSEHRPIVLIHDTKQAITTAHLDLGLGVAPDAVNATRLQSAHTTINEVRGAFEGLSLTQFRAKSDSCFLHDGVANPNVLSSPWAFSPVSQIANVRLLGINTYTNFANQTEERLNTLGADLVYASFEFANDYGMKQREFVWLIRGSQDVNGCASSGTGWRVLGNQRPIYQRTNTYAVHKIIYNGSFAGRQDSYGTGTTHHIFETSAKQYAFAIVSGPGLPADGAIFVKWDDAFMRYPGTISSIRSAALRNQVNPTIIDQLTDVDSVILTDASIAAITDAAYSPQNKYTTRYFENHGDLNPSLTLVDILPKRPYLNTELPPSYFPSVGVNLDALVTALQTSNSTVTVNWSLPNDLRGNPMLPKGTVFMRKNCKVSTAWPSCNTRSAQVNQFALGDTESHDPNAQAVDMTSPALPPTGSKTFESHVRAFFLDTLNRPIEVSVGMSYQR